MRSSRSGEVPRARTRVARCYLVCLRGVIAVVNETSVALIMVVLAAVAVRYLGVFAGSLHWATEFGRFAIIWIVMLGWRWRSTRAPTWRSDFDDSAGHSGTQRTVRSLGSLMGASPSWRCSPGRDLSSRKPR